MSPRAWLFALLCAGAILTATIVAGLRTRAERVGALPGQAAATGHSTSAESLRHALASLRLVHPPKPNTAPAASSALAARGQITQRSSAEEGHGAQRGPAIGLAEGDLGRVRESEPPDQGLMGGYPLDGAVTDEVTGLPIAGATITLIHGTTGQPVQTTTGEDGRFCLAGCPPDPHVLVVTSPDHLPARRSVTPGPGCDTLAIALSAGLNIEGRVVDVAGHPLENIRVEAPAAGRRTQTDALGRFTLERLEARPQDLVFTETKPPYQVTERLDVEPGGASLEVVFGWTPAMVEGRVVDQVTGAPQTAFTVTVDSLDLSTGQPAEPRVESLLDEDGHFAITLERPGHHRVLVQAGEGPPVARDFLVTHAGQRFTGVVFEIPDASALVANAASFGR